MNPPPPPSSFRRWRPHCPLLVIALLPFAGTAMAKPAKSESRDLKREANADAAANKPAKNSSDDAESRTMAKLRERLEVTDDAEWNVIAERVAKVEELRRSLWTPGASGRGGPSFTDKTKRTIKSGSSAHPEQDALRSAVMDKLPDAEIKSRLARAHELYRQNETRLLQAQSELRSVLTIRQEAVAVMAGLLPP